MYHKIVVVGNLGRDPEMRYTPSGQAVTNFSIASTRRYSDRNGEQREETIWFRISVWGKQAEVCNQYLSRGRQVLVEGRLIPDESGNPRTFQRQDGSTGASFEINAQTVRFLGNRSDAAGSGGGDAPAGMQTEDDIPF